MAGARKIFPDRTAARRDFLLPPSGLHASALNKKKIFAERGAQRSGPGFSNKRIKSWLRTIYPYSLDGIWQPQSGSY